MKNSLIIEQPRLQSIAQEMGWASVTLVFWAIYFYLWMPLLTLIAWYVSLNLFNVHLIELKGYQSFLELLKYYLLVIVGLGLILIGWAKIEHFRFSKKPGRLKQKVITLEEVAKYYHVPAHTLTSLRSARIINVHFAENGSISHFVKVNFSEKEPISHLCGAAIINPHV